MIRAYTHKGTPVWVQTINDVEPNKGGKYCMIHKNMYGDVVDDFCIHPEDCDCNNETEIINYVKNYVGKIKEY